jgi:hypothetical protein
LQVNKIAMHHSITVLLACQQGLRGIRGAIKDVQGVQGVQGGRDIVLPVNSVLLA